MPQARQLAYAVPAMSEAQAQSSAKAPAPARLVSLDAFRGFAMLFMASNNLGFPAVAHAHPDSKFWAFMGWQFDHSMWRGCTPWDLIQPAFTFMVGIAMPYSLASRLARGESSKNLFLHTLWRSFLLVALGIFLRSIGRKATNFTFEDTLSQIGLGYTFLFLLGHTRMRAQIVAAAVILVAYWAAFALFPLPPPGVDATSLGLAPNWPHSFAGFEAHWNKGTNLAAYVDRWFLNLFPWPRPFAFNEHGYATLNFVPTLATMIFGMLAGGLMRGDLPPQKKLRVLIGTGTAGIVAAVLLDMSGMAPLVKVIWTPTFTLFSGGWCALFLAAWYHLVDLRGYKRAAFPVVIVGMNSIAMYVVSHLWGPFIRATLRTHFGRNAFDLFGHGAAPVVECMVELGVLWLIILWMYRRKIFLRI